MARLALKTAAELTALGLREQRAGKLEQAARAYGAALSRDGQHVPALSLLGTLSMQQAQYERAASLLARACELAPALGVLHSNHGECLRRLGQHEAAIQAFERAVAASPELAEAWSNLALALEQLGLLSRAAEAYRAALELRPELAPAALGLLHVLRAERKFDEAIACYAALPAPLRDAAPVHRALAGALADVFRLDEALVHLERARELEPGSPEVQAELGAALLERGESDAALACLRRARELEPDNASHLSKLIYVLPFSPLTEPVLVLEAAREFGRRFASGAAPFSFEARDRNPERRLRVGYVSADLRQHPVACFMLPLLREHARNAVEVHCFSGVRAPDAVTAELRALADHWHDIARLDDDSAARLVHGQHIDVLVDLSLHSAGHRLQLFARRPAPVQASWLAYPGTTGVEAIDYRITDPQLDPPELGEQHYSECSLRLPETYWCYEPPDHDAPVTPLPALASGHVTFGSLNSFKKVSERALELWAELLAASPEAQLLLITPAGQCRERVGRVFAGRGVAPSRLELHNPLPRADYFRAYGRIDIGLDPFPYNGGTTTLDACWMGVPVVTLRGASAVARAGTTIAHHLGLPALIASSEREYLERARALARDLTRLAELRATLRERMRASPLMNAPRFARHLEQAFRQMWRAWC